MQESNAKRNLEIVRLCHLGMTVGDAGERFGISRERIRQILCHDERERELARQRLQIAGAIRLADDMDVRWPMADILEVLELPTVARNALKLHWTDGGGSAAERQICLRELMDLMSPVPDPVGYMTLPALGIRCIGKYGIEALVQGITRIELIGTCRQEWEKRLELIARWRRGSRLRPA